MDRPNFGAKKRALLEKLLHEQGVASARQQQIPRQPERAHYALSFAQRRLWFLNQLAPGNPFYNVAAAIPLDLWINVTALATSLRELVQRHETLRTTFTVLDGEPVQVIAPDADPEFPQIDLRHLAPDEREKETQRLTTENAQAPFDLEHGPLIRACLVRTGDHAYVLLLALHHIVCDGWSINLLSHELAVLYEAHVRSAPASLPELPIQYRDFAAWQQDWFLGTDQKAQIAYWKQQLADINALQLPTDHPRPALASYRGAHVPIEISKSLTLEVHSLCRSEGATPFMALLAVFVSLLYRYSGQDDILIGTPISGRNRLEIENLVGFFVNTLVIRADLAGDPTFREVLRRVRDVTLAAFAHQDVPFEKLVEELQPTRDLSRNPFFQVMFQFYSPPRAEDLPTPAQLATLRINRGVSIFDLAIHLSEHAHGFYGVLDYSSDLFEPETARRMARHFETLLQSAVDAPDRRVSLLAVQSEEERQAIVDGWNNTACDYSDGLCIPDLFEEQVRETPDATAVAFGATHLTYCELNDRANRLASQFQALGAGPDSLIGIYMERSIELVIALLGILKSGAAYVPLDPAYPAARIELMARAADFVVTHPPVANAWTAEGPKVVSIDADPDGPTSVPIGNPLRQTKPDHLAYVIYTSGSTGAPKGIAMTHRALVNLISWQLREPTFAHGAVVLQYASPSFDVSFQEIFSTWCSGGTLVLISEEMRRDPALLWQIIQQQRVERLFAPYVTLQQLAEAEESWRGAECSLREVITAGEQLKVTRSLAELFDALGDCALANQYGPTETHVVTACDLSGPALEWPPLPSIGRPIANTRIYLLDRYQQPVSIGVTGEVYVAGDALARGYLNAPGLTAERFVPDPYNPQPGARMYRTGDLARYLSNGAIEFLGRADDQIKLRGYRIEPGEVETAIAKHPVVQEVAVVLHGRDGSQPQLIAYVVAAPDQNSGGAPLGPDMDELPGELRRFVQAQLPAYMVPSRVVLLASMPTTASGKVDRRALPLPDGARPSSAHEYVLPRTALEAGLERIWSSLFHLPQISINDDFFADLGGHSLLATQFISAVRDTYRLQMPLTRIFEAPTIAEFAVYVEQALVEELEAMDVDDAETG